MIKLNRGKYPKYFVLAAVLAGAILFSSCSTSVALIAGQNNSGEVSLQTKLSPSVMSVVSALSGASSTEALFDKDQIVQSLKKTGYTVSGVRFPARNTLTINTQTAKLTDMLPNSKDFVSLKKDGKINDMVINLSPANIKKAVDLMPEETALYLDLLFAPIFTGEAMSADEYTELIAMAYGDNVAADLKKSIVTIQFDVPGQIVSAELTNNDKNTISIDAKFIKMSMPLVEMLTNLKGNVCRIRWTEE
ncbi:MAG: hypothetical protein MJ196_00750 [Treponemataceae bacterium]|nr:hypothetical protein [Treponemataceae bacterium]